MFFKSTLVAALVATLLALPAQAESLIEVHDAYAISATPQAPTGAAFMVIHNHGDQDDRLLSVRSDIASATELHTHTMRDDGVAVMSQLTDGLMVPAGGEVLLERGGHHVMFMGLNAPMEQGQIIPVTLVFENAGDVQIDVLVDLERMKMGAMGHSMPDPAASN